MKIHNKVQNCLFSVIFPSSGFFGIWYILRTLPDYHLQECLFHGIRPYGGRYSSSYIPLNIYSPLIVEPLLLEARGHEKVESPAAIQYSPAINM